MRKKNTDNDTIALCHCKRNFLWSLQVAQILYDTVVLSNSKFKAHKPNHPQSTISETQGQTWTLGGEPGGIVQPLNRINLTITFGFNNASR